MRNNRLDLLNPYIGKWKTEGLTQSGEVITGTDTYEWIEGGFFLMHKIDVTFNKKKIQSLEIIHYDDMEDVFRSQSFDNAGKIAISTLKIYDDIILIFADTERFKGNFKGNTIEGLWEQFNGNCWEPWMDIKLTKIKH
ncbi:DUF1579 domain-containing protein [Pedobacter sp. KBS0701]|uniref:DUF1579 domain-containing protein n=1 Tax=Pedobacter sp. KBS0701 TaxID=2578106 RepID=UPI00110E9DB5|nr:DUF1579 domain-containing protein [Pedobacter sp. KBS0701]QDW24213.1 DUF1579 domain-containing protein [Pedobacter sp. KBS0701]